MGNLRSQFLIFFISISNIIFGNCGHNIHPHFMKWMKKHLKEKEVKQIVRNELITGSFGGGPYNGTARPIIFVHGLNNEAGSFWKVRRDFAKLGFPKERTFATTWGKGAKNIDLDVEMSCNHVVKLRRFIQIVYWYTQSKQVDIIGYSMGSPLVRKAILGGKCVDKEYDMGPPITNRVHTFISVAGANQGATLCAFPFFKVCNLLTGLSCGSKFLEDINSKKNYEATGHQYNLASSADSVVGFYACGKQVSEFPASENWIIGKRDHEQTEFDTADIQLRLIRGGGNIFNNEETHLWKKSKKEKKGDSKKKNDPFATIKEYMKFSGQFLKL